MIRRFLPLFLCLALLTSCDDESKAKKTAKQFLKENLAETSFNIKEVSRLDSTFVITDSIVEIMRQNTSSQPQFTGKKIQWSKRDGSKLRYARIIYKVYDKEFTQTFYFDDQFEHVIAVKN